MISSLATLPTPAGSAALSVSLLADSWRGSSRGRDYIQALGTWLASFVSDHSRKSAAYAVSEFCAWYEATYGRVPLPADVTRAQALGFVKHLRERTLGMQEQRLTSDPSRAFDLAIYRYVRQNPGAHLSAIRRHLLGQRDFTTSERGERVLLIEQSAEPDALERYLGCMIELQLLRRTPTIENIRSGRFPMEGVDDPSRAQIDWRVDPDVFAYRVAVHSHAQGVERAGTVRRRLGALQSFWTYLIEGGENVGPDEPLLRYNIWTRPTHDTLREAREQAKVSRAQRTPGIELFNRVLGTTYTPDGVRRHDFESCRDRALLTFVFHLAARATEAQLVRRRDVTILDGAPFVTLLGKGNKPRMLPLPEAVTVELGHLTAKLEQMATAAEQRAPSMMARAQYLLQPEAPLFPVVKLWGCNAGRAETELGISQDGMVKMLHRRAAEAGIAPEDADFRRLHPHGIRHLAAQLARAAGRPLGVIQAVLGHTSLATTGLYTEVRDPRELLLFGQAVAPAVAPAPPIVTPVAPPRGAAPVRRPRVVPAAGVSVPAEVAPVEPIRPTLEAVPTPPPEAVPEAEHLVSVGAGTPLLEPVQEAAVAALDAIYAGGWGEPGPAHSAPLATGKEKGTVAPDVLLTLQRTRFGHQSGLGWWSGPTGHLSPYMPVISAPQIRGEETVYGSVRDQLTQIWSEWIGRESDRGPTAALALVRWLRDALNVAADVDSEVERRDGTWLPYTAPLAATEIDPKTERTVFREHRDDRVADWFAQAAWQHRQSIGRAAGARTATGRPPRVIDTPLVVPAYYALIDPLSELLASERAELFDWLRALTGRALADSTPRFDGRSRRDIGEVLGLLFTYDEMLREAKESGGYTKSEMRQIAQATGAQIAKIARKQFDLEATVAARIEQTRHKLGTEALRKARAEQGEEAAESEEDIEQRRRGMPHFYLGIVRNLFGPEAAADYILGIKAHCAEADAPLAGSGPRLAEGAEWRYADLFHVAGNTIEHTPAFRQAFAEATGGAHSECVARRMTRDMWELRKTPKRPDELLEWVNSMAFYKIPCPAAMERELRQRMATTAPLPVLEEWEAARAAMRRGEVGPALRRRGETLGAFAEAGEVPARPARPEFEPNARAREYTYTPNARPFVPCPIILLFCIYAR